jgi:uncharacterized protein with von Willebrand factor type A (vWA) domain
MNAARKFEVRASLTTAAMPRIDHLLPAFNEKSLRTLVCELARI